MMNEKEKLLSLKESLEIVKNMIIIDNLTILIIY